MTSDIPFDAILAAYNRRLGSFLPKALRMHTGRKVAIRARWQEDAEQQTVEWWDALFARAAASDFLTGRRPPGQGHENWRPNFDWIIKPSTITKILEGSYDNRDPRTDLSRVVNFR